jgi:hypothetical protein
MIDTLKLANRLSSNGMDRKQAEAIAEELAAGMKESAVTKGDLNEAITKVKNELIIWQIGIAFAIVGLVKLIK